MRWPVPLVCRWWLCLVVGVTVSANRARAVNYEMVTVGDPGTNNTTAETVFTDNFDMRGNYTQYLFSTSNAIVSNEAPSFPDVTYWAPNQDNVWAEIVYRYNLPFTIDTASIYANLMSFPGYDPAAQAYLDISPDGVNYATVEQGYVENRQPQPINISSLLKGSSTAYVRARLFESVHFGSIRYSQFLRTTDDPQLQSPNVYQFQAVSIPEPSTYALALAGLACSGYSMFRRRRAR